MPKLPVVSGNEMIKVAQKKGFTISRQKGSHVILYNADGVRLVIPQHANLKTGTLIQILKTLQINREELNRLI